MDRATFMIFIKSIEKFIENETGLDRYLPDNVYHSIVRRMCHLDANNCGKRAYNYDNILRIQVQHMFGNLPQYFNFMAPKRYVELSNKLQSMLHMKQLL